MLAEMINKIIITPEAVCDYEHCMGVLDRPPLGEVFDEADGGNEKGYKAADIYERPFRKIEKRLFKAEVEDYINLMNSAGRLRQEKYFRCLYFDVQTWQMLMLFFYRAERFSIMQNWELNGICAEDDWSEDLEDFGLIRKWLRSYITGLEKGDWVTEQRVRAEADKIMFGFSVRGSIEGLPKEIKV